MSARVDCRLGSIFDEACDLLVIPSSAGGTVTPGVQQEMRKAGIPFPDAMTWGSVTLSESPIPRFSRVAYAATVSGQGTTLEIVRKIGAELGSIAAALPGGAIGRVMGAQVGALLTSSPVVTRGLRGFLPFPLRISAPLLGTGAGDLEPREAALALKAGFVSTAPESALLVISIRDKEDYEDVAEVLKRPEHAPRQDASVAPAVDDDGPVGALGRGLPLLAGQREIAKGAGAPPAPVAAPGPSAATPPAAAASQRKGVFISYAHADAEWLERLQKHLKPLQREGIDVWDDTRLKPGEPWREEIRDALAATKVAVLLISADFLASDFIVTDELPPLLKAAAEGGATILPVIISPCRFKRMESLSRFQAVNDPDKPLAKLRHANREEVLDQVAQAVEDALKR